MCEGMQLEYRGGWQEWLQKSWRQERALLLKQIEQVAHTLSVEWATKG